MNILFALIVIVANVGNDYKQLTVNTDDISIAVDIVNIDNTTCDVQANIYISLDNNVLEAHDTMLTLTGYEDCSYYSEEGFGG